MAEYFRFFNTSADDPREYLAADFAEYFSRFLTDGLYVDEGNTSLKPVPGTGLSVKINPGYAFIRGYMYHNDADLQLNLEPADNVLSRMDRVVLRFDEVAREIRLRIKTGTFASEPTPPSLEESSTVKELGIARVLVPNNLSEIKVQHITDDRFTDACGVVSSLITIPIQDLWNSWLEQRGDIYNEWESQSDEIDGEWSGFKVNWVNWFESVQNDLGIRVMIGEEEPANMEVGDLWFKIL